MKRMSWLLVALGAISAVAWAAQQEAKPVKAESADLTWMPTKDALLVSVRVADLWNGEMGKALRDKLKEEGKFLIDALAQEAGLPPDQVERFTIVQGEFGRVPLFFVRSTKDLDKDKFLAKILPGGEEKKSGGFTYIDAGLKAGLMLGTREYVLGTSGDIETLIDKRKEKTDKGLAPAIALAGKGHSIVVGLNTPLLHKADADLPPDAEPFRPLLKSKFATVVADLGPKTNGQIQITFDKDDEAKDAEKALEKVREMGLSAIDGVLKQIEKDETEGGKALVALVGQARVALKAGKVTRADRTLTAKLESKFDTAQVGIAGMFAGQRMRAASQRMISANNLKQIALAMHNFHDTAGTLPANAVYDKNGKALLSWRVLILPYIDHKDLYDKFKLDEPWDSKHNKALIEKMPRIYTVPNDKSKPGMTGYMGLVGKSAVFDGKTGIRIQDITDGTSNTIMVVETDKQVPWTKPDDLSFDKDKDPPAIQSVFEGGFHAMYCDGSVRFMRSDIKKDTLKALITRDGGEVIPND